MMKSLRYFLSLLFFAALVFVSAPSQAFEGDWEVGAAPSAIVMLSRDIYGGGAELFARYTVYDGLSIDLNTGLYGAQQIHFKETLGIYNLRVGVIYTLDILEWVPGAGVHLSAMFSEDKRYVWHTNGKGLGIDVDLYVQYRGIRQMGIGIFFAYHLVFVGADYMTAGFSISWHSDRF